MYAHSKKRKKIDGKECLGIMGGGVEGERKTFGRMKEILKTSYVGHKFWFFGNFNSKYFLSIKVSDFIEQKL